MWPGTQYPSKQCIQGSRRHCIQGSTRSSQTMYTRGVCIQGSSKWCISWYAHSSFSGDIGDYCRWSIQEITSYTEGNGWKWYVFILSSPILVGNVLGPTTPFKGSLHRHLNVVHLMTSSSQMPCYYHGTIFANNGSNCRTEGSATSSTNVDLPLPGHRWLCP